MEQFVTALLSALPAGNCGCTVDWHRGDDSGNVVQWLWAAPVGEDSPSEQDVRSAIESLHNGTGFEPDVSHSFHVSLPNSVELLENCPFQPAECLGEHLVASGSGRLHY